MYKTVFSTHGSISCTKTFTLAITNACYALYDSAITVKQTKKADEKNIPQNYMVSKINLRHSS